MTLIRPPSELPPALLFLDTVCPGVPVLADNTHFDLKDAVPDVVLRSLDNVTWPLAVLEGAVGPRASIDSTYLNVGRPAFEHNVHKNCESTTYVSLPYHITSLFAEVVKVSGLQKQDGSLHVGAHVNPLMHDPFRLVHLNPGCMSSMISLGTLRSLHHPDRNPFNKMTTSINRLLRMGGIADSQDSSQCHFVPLADKAPLLKLKKEEVFSVLELDQNSYFSRLKAKHVARLLVSVNVNVVNVFELDEHHNFAGTATVNSTTPIFPQLVPESENNETESLVPAYKKVVEKPLLRLQFLLGLVATSMYTLSPEPMAIFGLNNGSLVMLNLSNLTYRVFDDLGHDHAKLSYLDAVTSLTVIHHPQHEMLIVAGYANGEVYIIDPSAAPPPQPYKKTVVGEDRFSTYFKKFDLSSFGRKETGGSYIVGHFKLSHKPITAISSTIPYNPTCHFPQNPLILALASEDGLVRFIDLIATYGENFGDLNQFYNQLIITDIISSYFQDGVRSIEFSPDLRFFCLSGKGDMIEIYKMSYYNVNGLLSRNNNPQPRTGRSRSGTVNSNNLTGLQPLLSFLSPTSITPSTSLDLPREEHSNGHHTHHPPIIKDITIVSRLKGHTNTVDRVSFVKKETGLGSYNLISCGSDGKVIIWEFDSKALPRVNKSHIIKSSHKQSVGTESQQFALPQPINGRAKPGLLGKGAHQRTRSLNQLDENPLSASFSALGINTLLSPSPQPLHTLGNYDEEQMKIVFSFYRSLYEVRLRKYYPKQQAKDIRHRYATIIHGVVNDKELPSIQVPLLTLDFSMLVKDGKIYGFHCTDTDFWVFGRNGDIFRYRIKG